MVRRAPETLVDWLVVGIAPFLIMLLVGSLVFYLVEVFYLGEYQLRLLWVLGLFVMAIVCIARISMEEGAGYASLYALPLAGAVGLAVATFVKVSGPLAPLGPVVNWGLMALVWWAAHKLTWDCTLTEGARDFTGQGLMQTTGLDRFFSARPCDTQTAEPRGDSSLEVTSATDKTRPEAVPFWQAWLRGEQRPHGPGVWVVYFSLAALPLFGLGQWFIPAGDLPLRRRAFWLLVVYVAAGLSLLMATSFLSLRRYLRQRNCEMPGEIAAVWLGAGAMMVLAILIVASLLPRPIPEYSITHLAPEIKAPERTASRWGWGKEGAKSKSKAAPTGTKGSPPAHAKPTNSQGTSMPDPHKQSRDARPSGQQASPTGSQSKSGDQNASGNQGSQGKTSQSQAGQYAGQTANNGPKSNEPPARGNDQNQPAEDSNQESSPKNATPNESSSGEPLPNETPPPPPLNQSFSHAVGQLLAYFTHVLKWLFYLIVAAVVAWFAWRYREQLYTAWLQLLAELRVLWQKWFGQQPAAAPAAAMTSAATPPKRFRDFADPFATGLAARWSLAELVRYTFEALEARGREHNCPRGAEQTPLEYAAAVGQLEPALASEFRSLADLYGQLAFASGGVAPQARMLLEQLWRRW